MIDIEAQVLTLVRAALVAALGEDGFEITSEYKAKPDKFPCIYLHESDNTTLSMNGSNVEDYAAATYSVEVYTNKTVQKKTQARAIMAIIDGVLCPSGFTRRAMTSLPNMADATIYRLFARYTAAVSKDEGIYRR